MTDIQAEKNNRLKNIRKKLGLTQQEMANILGIVRSNLSKIEMNLDGRNAPKDTFYILNEKYGLNKDWWETGLGEMFNSNSSTTDLEETNLPTERRSGVPFYDVDVTASITGSYMDIKEEPEYFVDFQPFNDCDAMTRVYGDSMYPKYQSGEIIAIKKLTNFDIMRWGETHLIITDSHYDDLRTIKNIYPCDDDDHCIYIEASNPNYKGKNKILKKHILGLFLVKGKAAVHHM